MKNRKLHFRISEDGKPDFGFDVVTDLSDLDIIDLFDGVKVVRPIKARKLIRPPTPPRYDEVYEKGVKWLDSL